ncbi:aldehyde dehydrogenase family protein [Actinoplanes couchii]|uniref:Aldehyde dehydrogenase n=2 Tax=Actinoplanes couchii TaxID=403638 RepID=A0ABQ3XPA9_9ACTN|nr:aldehyde dehydrogenase (NAD+) [Actinoplanes couchii]GID60323.1 aldehyde dehydrogenase [Actinoplanes couchii]
MGTSIDVVGAAVDRARPAATWWGGLGYKERRVHLLAWKRHIARRIDELAALIAAETGKSPDDAALEVMLAVEHLDWAARNAGKVLGRRKVPSGMLAANHAATLEYLPLGVVGVIGPWNYPVYTPLGSVSYALAAGNAVVFKPSEHTPETGAWLATAWIEAVPEAPVLQAVLGDGSVGAALVWSGVDKIAFTGSAATARKVMATCAETLTPLVVEGGGKDAMIVAADADLDAAARAAAFGGFGNAGQTCAGVERVYVEKSVFNTFVDKVSALAVGEFTMTTPEQPAIVRAHVEDALLRGGKAVVGGAESIKSGNVAPVILTDVPEDSIAVTEETFGPTLVINPVDSVAEAIKRTNHSKYGLAASIFTRNAGAAMDTARKLRAGAASINAVLGFASVPSLPFGGVGDSGFGRIHGADGLREFSRAQSVTRQRFNPPMDLVRLDRDPHTMARALKLFRMRHGR